MADLVDRNSRVFDVSRGGGSNRLKDGMVVVEGLADVVRRRNHRRNGNAFALYNVRDGRAGREDTAHKSAGVDRPHDSEVIEFLPRGCIMYDKTQA